MHERIRRIGLGAAGLAALGVALGLLVPLAFAGSHHAKRAAQQVSCQVPQTPTPTFPLELNTVSIGTLAKSVAMEKDVYSCTEPTPTGTTSLTRDVETFVELVEREVIGGTPNVVTLPPRVFFAVCDKTPTSASNGGGVACKKTFLKVTKATTPPLTNQCGQPVGPLPDPVEMNSVNLDNNWVKTIKVEKEIYLCDDGQAFNDLYLFTEALEQKNSDNTDFNPAIVRFIGVVCKRSKFDGTIGPCVFFVPTVLP